MDDFADKRGVSTKDLRSFAINCEGGPYRRLKKHLPEDLFPKIKRDKKSGEPVRVRRKKGS
jgi:hypothetical protein